MYTLDAGPRTNTGSEPYVPPLLDCLVLVHFGPEYIHCDSEQWFDHYFEDRVCERAQQYKESEKPVFIIETEQFVPVCPRLDSILEEDGERIPVVTSYFEQFSAVAKSIQEQEHRQVEIGGIAKELCVYHTYLACKETGEIEPVINPLLTRACTSAFHYDEDTLCEMQEWFWDENASLLTKGQMLTYKEKITDFYKRWRREHQGE